VRGRRPKPTALHRLQGTYNVTDHRDHALEPIAEGEIGEPADLTEAQRAIWRYVVAHAPEAVLKAIDQAMLRAWVETVDRRNEAQQLLEAETSATTWLASATHRVIDRTTTLLIRLASELGFSPAARPRLRVEAPKPPKEDTDPWAELRVIPGGRPE